MVSCSDKSGCLYDIKLVQVIENIVAFMIIVLSCSFNKMIEIFCHPVKFLGSNEGSISKIPSDVWLYPLHPSFLTVT
jgi:hypothetical protein